MKTLSPATPEEPNRRLTSEEIMAQLRQVVQEAREKDAAESVRERVRKARRPVDDRMAAPMFRAALREAVRAL